MHLAIYKILGRFLDALALFKVIVKTSGIIQSFLVIKTFVIKLLLLLFRLPWKVKKDFFLTFSK